MHYACVIFYVTQMRILTRKLYGIYSVFMLTFVVPEIS